MRKPSVHWKISSHFSEPKKVIKQRRPASFLLEGGHVWNSSKFKAVHPEAAGKLISSLLLNWNLPSSDEPFQASTPVSEQHDDCPPTPGQGTAAETDFTAVRAIFTAEQNVRPAITEEPTSEKNSIEAQGLCATQAIVFFYQPGK